MTARLAPIWSALGDNYLINNRDFLIQRGPQEGVQFNISVDGKVNLKSTTFGEKIMYQRVNYIVENNNQ